MAQDVAEKIRAAAVAKGIDPDTALRIAGVESSYNPNAKNPSSSAQGLFQVIDDTWKRYGGKPGKQRDTDENIRVGMLILEDNTNKLSKILGRAPRPSELYTAHFFGTGTGAEVLRADPDTPINRIASKKVMAANPHLKGLTVGELMAKHEAKFARTPGTPAYAGKKGGERQDDTQKMMTDSLSSGQTAQAQPTVLDDPRIKALGTNYQMALAATTLADKGDKDDDTTESERFQQYMEERQEEAVRAQEPEPARKALASFDLGYKSPFVDDVPVQQAPIQMAVGGTVTNVNALIRPSDKKKLKSANEQLAAYQKSYDQYKTDHEKYLGQRDSYNAAAEKHNEQMGGYKTAAQKYEEQLGSYNTAAQKYNEQMGGYKTAAEKYNAEVEAYNAAAIKAKEAADKWLEGYENAGSKNKKASSRRRAKKKYAAQNPAPTFDMTAPAAFNMTAPAAFDMVAPTFNLTQPTFDMTAPVEPNAPTAPTVDPQAIARAAEKETAQRSAALSVFSDPDRYNLSLPKLFAGGGMASSAPPPSTGIRQSDKEAINSANAQWEQYKASVEKYNADADAYNAWYKDYDATVNAPRKHSANSRRPSLEKRHARYIAKNPQPTFDPAAQPVAPGVQPQELLALAQKKANNRNFAIDAFFNPDKYNLSFSEGGEVEEPYTPGKVAKMGEDNSKYNLQEFLPPSKMSVQALDNLLISAGLDVSKVGRGQKLDLAKTLYAQANGQVGDASLYARMSNESNRPEMLGGMSLPMGNGRASVDVNPGGVNYGYQTRLGSGEIIANFFKPMQGPGQGSVQYRMPLGRAEGGAVYRAEGSPETGERLTPQQIEQIAQRQQDGREYRQNMLDAPTRGDTYTGLAKGFFQNVVPNVVGIPTDIATMAMRPFGYKVEKPFLGSEYNKEKLTEYGLRPEPPKEGTNERNFYDVGNIASFFVNPASATRKTVEKTGKVAKDFQAYNQALGPAGVSYAAKPRGGTFLTSGSVDKPALSKLDKTIEQWSERSVRDAPDDETAKLIKDFLDKKGRKYLTNELGTGADPIRTALASGQIQPIGNDAGRFPEYLLHSARTPDAPGHLSAKQDLEKLYDRASTVEGRVIGRHDPSDADARNRFNAVVSQSETNARNMMTQEGVPLELQNLDIQGMSGSQLSSSINADLLNAINAPQEFPAIAGAVQRNQPIYDLNYPGTYMQMFSPKTVSENINALPANKLKSMSFADAMIEGSKLLEVSRNYDKAVELVSKGAVVPKEVVMQFTKPVIATDKGQWVQLTDKQATKMEGKMLHHSIGGYADNPSYNHGGPKAFDAGDAKVFSLRDPKTGLAKVSIEGKRLDDGRTEITQIKGDFNSFPGLYTNDIFNFFDHMGYKITFPKTREHYRNSPTGQALDDPIILNWGETYEKWAKNKDVDVSNKLPPPPGQVDLPFAKGGMVEKNSADNRRYL